MFQDIAGFALTSGRSTACVSLVTQTYGMVVGRLFVDKYFDKTAKRTVSIVHCLRQNPQKGFAANNLLAVETASIFSVVLHQESCIMVNKCARIEHLAIHSGP